MAHKLAVQKGLKGHSFIQFVENALLFIGRENRLVVVVVYPILDPARNLGFADVGVLHPNALAVDEVEVADDFLEGGGAFEAQLRSYLKGGFKVGR